MLRFLISLSDIQNDNWFWDRGCFLIGLDKRSYFLSKKHCALPPAYNARCRRDQAYPDVILLVWLCQRVSEQNLPCRENSFQFTESYQHKKIISYTAVCYNSSCFFLIMAIICNTLLHGMESIKLLSVMRYVMYQKTVFKAMESVLFIKLPDGIGCVTI